MQRGIRVTRLIRLQASFALEWCHHKSGRKVFVLDVPETSKSPTLLVAVSARIFHEILLWDFDKRAVDIRIDKIIGIRTT